MTLLPTCRDISFLLTDYLEDQLPVSKAIGIRLHLGLCPPCQAFANSLRALPGLVRQALGQEDGQPPEVPGSARIALEGALARVGQPRGPRPGPCCDLPEAVRSALDEGRADGPLRTMVEVHRSLLEDGPVPEPPHLPASALGGLPPAAAWRWSSSLAGFSFAPLAAEGPSTLYLVCLGRERTAPAHVHRGEEQSLLLQGGLEDGPVHYGPGAWSVQGAGTRHAPQATARGCWALVRVEEGVDLLGWRGWIQRAMTRP